MVKNSRTSEEDLREVLAEKAWLTAQEVARKKLEEQEPEDCKGLGDPN